MSLKGKTLFITGASRGIGLAIALRAARDGANVVVAAKTTEPHPKLPGTIHTAAAEIEKAGGKALPIALDIRDDVAVQEAARKAAETFGGIDILVNNASAINLTGTLATPMKRFDLMFGVNVRGTYCCSQACLPYLKKAANPHILTLSPPLNMKPRWFRDHVAYTTAKYGMSMCVLGMAEEFRVDGVAVNALWPRTVIATAAVAMLGDRVKPENCRKPEIVADAAYAILNRDSRSHTGNFYVDDEVLAEEGVRDLERYALVPGKARLLPDFFLD
jgi:citronellol/citronellal dehydrogenase